MAAPRRASRAMRTRPTAARCCGSSATSSDPARNRPPVSFPSEQAPRNGSAPRPRKKGPGGRPPGHDEYTLYLYRDALYVSMLSLVTKMLPESFLKDAGLMPLVI